MPRSRFEVCIENMMRVFQDEERARKICRKIYNPVSDEEVQKIKEYALGVIRSQPDTYHVVYKLPSGIDVDIILVFTPNVPKIKETENGNYKIGVVMPGPGPNIWVSAFFFSKEDAEYVASHPDSPFLLIGKLRQRNVTGSTLYSMNVYAYIPLFEEEESEYEYGGESEAVEEASGSSEEEAPPPEIQEFTGEEIIAQYSK